MKKLLLFSSFSIFIFLFTTATNARAQAKKAVGGANATGTFREAASGSEFSILALGKGKLRVAFSGLYKYKLADGKYTTNFGEASGEASISGDTATFTPPDTEHCTMILKFLARGRLKVSQKGNDSGCGFGMNVSAAGDYKKISGRRPKF